MSGGIRLSPKHGVNPSMGQCFYCGEDDGTVVLPGRLPNDEEAPRRAVWTMEPCPKCKEWMKQGVIIIVVPSEQDKNTRLGFFVVKEDAFRRLAGPEMAEAGLKRRAVFIDLACAKLCGLWKEGDKA